MTDNIIRIDGVEYDGYDYVRRAIELGFVQPKRKQTGWICRNCASPCVIGGYYPDDGEKRCPLVAQHGSQWHPFYGKVVE